MGPKQTRKTCFELRAAIEEAAEMGVTQKKLAELCGVKEVQVWRWCDGKAEVPQYVWTIMSLFQIAPIEVVWGEVGAWKVKKHHVFRNGKKYKALAKRFHPDITGRDTTAEMQLINAFRSK